MRALILAAGEGRRMQPVTLTTPKPLVEVAGTPMAVRQILALRKAGVEEIVLNVAHLGDRIVETLGDGSAWGVRLRYSVEGRTAGEALETLGGIAKALPMLDDGDGAFIVVAGDIVTDFDYSRLVRAGRALAGSDAVAHLVLAPNPSYHADGDMTLRGRRACSCKALPVALAVLRGGTRHGRGVRGHVVQRGRCARARACRGANSKPNGKVRARQGLCAGRVGKMWRPGAPRVQSAPRIT